MNIVILGASGFMGQSITKALGKTGVDLTLFDMHFSRDQRENFRCLEGDFSTPADLEPVLNGEVDTVIHLISTTVPVTGDKYPAADVRGNLLNTLDFFDLCISTNVRRVIFASSGGTVYGVNNNPSKEDDPCRPICSYGIVKRAIEEYLGLYHRLNGLEYLVMRVGNPYGVAQTGKKPQGIIGTSLHRIIKGEPLEVWGEGNVVRDFIHIDDVAQAFVSAVQYSGPEKVFNVGTGIGHSIKEVLEMIETTVAENVERKYLPQNSLDIPFSVLDITRIQQEMDWEPITPWPKVFRKYIMNVSSPIMTS